MPQTIYRIGHSLFRVTGQLAFGYRVIHPERLIEDGPALIASNHASFLDPPMVGIAYDDPIWYLAHKTLFRHPFFNWLYRHWQSIPVDQDNPDFTSLKTIIKKLREGDRVLIFPEGQRSFDGELLEGQPGVGLVIAKSRAPVQPVRLFGTHEAMARGRSWPRLRRITLVVGEPIYFTDEELKAKGKDEYQALANRVMDAIAALELPEGREPGW
ncbi:MAG: lysophospholipid acyltransferase family protein [Verrucomicrobiales bacterium]